MFTLEGKFVAEQFVGIDSKYPLQARSIAFSPDQRFLYVGGTPGTYILNRRTLEVLLARPRSAAAARIIPLATTSAWEAMLKVSSTSSALIVEYLLKSFISIILTSSLSKHCAVTS